MASESKKPHVVVLGAGMGGHGLVHALEKTKKFSITVIDRKDYWENNIGGPRFIVQPDVQKQANVPHTTWMALDSQLVVGDGIICSFCYVMCPLLQSSYQSPFVP
jgi:cation diffusion facilitator CzcD-associated flavoprotein CzcO